MNVSISFIARELKGARDLIPHLGHIPVRNPLTKIRYSQEVIDI